MKRRASAGLYPVMTIKLTTLWLFSTLALGGCMSEDTGDGSTDPAATGTTEQAVAGTMTTWHPCSSLQCSVQISADADHNTCFLSGITGKLASGSSAYPAGTAVVKHTWSGRAPATWDLYISNPNYQNISVGTTCITGASNQRTATWHAGDSATYIPGSFGRGAASRCFMSGVYSYNSIGFSGWNSFVHIWADGGGHYLGGSLPAGSSDVFYATCVDVPYAEDWLYGNGTSSPWTDTISYNPASGGMACGLTGFGGQFTTSDPNDGVWLDYDGGTRYWNFNLSPWKSIYAECVK